MTISTFEETAVLSVALSRCDLRRHCLHKSLVDHSFTTDKRGNNGDCTSQKFWKRCCSEQKRLKINGNYYKKHQKSLGKDEVTSSNLVSSSRTTPEIFGFRVFSFDFGNFLNEYGFADFC